MTRLHRAMLFAAIACLSAVPAAHAFMEKIHQKITKDSLGFLRPDVLEIINRQHMEEDNIPGQSGKSDHHFNDCDFDGASRHIRSHHARAAAELKKKNPREAAERFGELLHTVQDFYSHSNWVESGQTGLLGEGLGEWPALRAMQQLPSGAVLLGKVGKSDPKGRIEIAPAMTVTFKEGARTRPAIVTGAVGKTGKCPAAVHRSLGHWKEAPMLVRAFVQKRTYGLNKDDTDAGARHVKAKELARRATRHEWCRLVSLVAKSGPGAVDALVKAWAKDQKTALEVCAGPVGAQR